MSFGIKCEYHERQFPTPPEWSFLSRYHYRTARLGESPDPETGLIDWCRVGSTYRGLIQYRLEDENIDGRDLRPILQDEGDIYVAGVGKSGLDISLKSEPWRRGYHAALMGLAKAAENTEGMVADSTTMLAFPREVVIGPSNPRPKALPPGTGPAPLEENCVPAFEPPEKYYLKILTTHGFTSRQRLEAALACADWLDYKELTSTAEEMFDWAIDIAMGGLPVGVNNILDIKSGVINSKASYVSSNILAATTALAYHHAQNNNLPAALPIFLSVLRARRQLSAPSTPEIFEPKDNAGSLRRIFALIKSLLNTPPYPPPPPTGDESPTRTKAAVCEEAGVMSHIGEILFASSSASSFAEITSSPSVGTPIATATTAGQLQNYQAGLGWTRDAVDLAEETLALADKDDEEARNKCSECLAIGIENWSTMVSKMLKDEKSAKSSQHQKSSGNWFWGNGNVADQEGRWEREARLVDERLVRVRKQLIKEEERKQAA